MYNYASILYVCGGFHTVSPLHIPISYSNHSGPELKHFLGDQSEHTPHKKKSCPGVYLYLYSVLYIYLCIILHRRRSLDLRSLFQQTTPNTPQTPSLKDFLLS